MNLFLRSIILSFCLALCFSSTICATQTSPTDKTTANKTIPTTTETKISITHGTLVFENPVFRALKGAQNGSVYFNITQKGKENDRLLSASCAFSKTVEIHNHIMDDTLKIKKMVQMPHLDIPGTHSDCWFLTCPFTAKEKPVELKKGGLHLMLMELTPQIHDQNEIELTLNFEKAGTITIACQAESKTNTSHECDCPHHKKLKHKDGHHKKHDHKHDHDHKDDKSPGHNHDKEDTH